MQVVFIFCVVLFARKSVLSMRIIVLVLIVQRIGMGRLFRALIQVCIIVIMSSLGEIGRCMAFYAISSS